VFYLFFFPMTKVMGNSKVMGNQVETGHAPSLHKYKIFAKIALNLFSYYNNVIIFQFSQIFNFKL